MEVLSFIKGVFSKEKAIVKEESLEAFKPIKNIVKETDITKAPISGRVSRPSLEYQQVIQDLKSGTKFITQPYIAEVIPVIRKLAMINPDLGLALNDIIQLTNTGHTIRFDKQQKADEVQKMRLHLKNKQEEWGDGVDGINGLINKLIAQVYISGALCLEIDIANDKSGVYNVPLVNPETINFAWNTRTRRYESYQKQNPSAAQINVTTQKMVKMNPYTFIYYAIGGDTDLPYGIPPYLTALNSISVQGDMDKNIRYIMKQLGLLGFFEAKIEKPTMIDGENEAQYGSRLNSLLTESRNNLEDGLNDGIVVGFKDDHEFNFNATGKNLTGVGDVYQMNEVQVANGLKTSPSFLGVKLSGTETGITIVFTKMLSQLSNVQSLLSRALRKIYTTELRLAGYTFQNLEVEFNPSTITDDMKTQQAEEVRIRNVNNKYLMGIIDQQQAADELGYDTPDQPEPRAPIDNSAKDREDREKKKDESDKRVRDKNKPQPKSK